VALVRLDVGLATVASLAIAIGIVGRARRQAAGAVDALPVAIRKERVAVHVRARARAAMSGAGRGVGLAAVGRRIVAVRVRAAAALDRAGTAHARGRTVRDAAGLAAAAAVAKIRVGVGFTAVGIVVVAIVEARRAGLDRAHARRTLGFAERDDTVRAARPTAAFVGLEIGFAATVGRIVVRIAVAVAAPGRASRLAALPLSAPRGLARAGRAHGAAAAAVTDVATDVPLTAIAGRLIAVREIFMAGDAASRIGAVSVAIQRGTGFGRACPTVGDVGFGVRLTTVHRIAVAIVERRNAAVHPTGAADATSGRVRR